MGDYKDLSNKIIYYEKNKKKLINKINYTYKSLHRFDYLSNLKNYLKVINKELN